jgi:hypothetical protein
LHVLHVPSLSDASALCVFLFSHTEKNCCFCCCCCSFWVLSVDRDSRCITEKLFKLAHKCIERWSRRARTGSSFFLFLVITLLRLYTTGRLLERER